MLSAKREESKPTIVSQSLEALKYALAYLLILQVLTVHEGHVEPDSVRQLHVLLPSRLLRKARLELLHTAWVSLLQSVTTQMCLAPLRTGRSVSREIFEMALLAAVAGCHWWSATCCLEL